MDPKKKHPKDTVGGNPANQLRLVAYPIIYRLLYIPGGCLGFLPSTVSTPKTNFATRANLHSYPLCRPPGGVPLVSPKGLCVEKQQQQSTDNMRTSNIGSADEELPSHLPEIWAAFFQKSSKM